IEKEQLPITDVSLTHITDDYLKYIEAHEPPPLELADFLVIATRLLLIKSHAILPREEILETENETSLAAQLKLYKIFSEAAGALDVIHQNGNTSFGRAFPDVLKADSFVLPQGISLETIQQSFERLLKQLEPFFRIQQAAIERVMSVKERLHQIQEALLSRSRFFFHEFVKSGQSKVDIVVSFLAVLELVKQRSVSVIQSQPFSDIELKRID
ncbi:MAG: ScpA family protein, partial [Patescibacteria group bacterium]